MAFSERDMEDAIAEDPQKYLDEEGLILIARQYRIGRYIFDLLFEDRHGAKLIVELQKGTLDRNHTYKILDYFDEYKVNHANEFVELMVVANRIPRERRNRLSSYGIAFKEIPASAFSPTKTVDAPLSAHERAGTSSNSDEGSAADKASSTKTRPTLRRFFQELLVLSNAQTSIFRDKTPESVTKRTVFLGKKVGYGKTHMDWDYDARNKRPCVLIHLFHPQPDINEKRILSLQAHQDEIQSAFGETLEWDYKPGRQTQYIRSPTPVGTIDDIGKWPEIQQDLIDRLIRLEKAVRKYINGALCPIVPGGRNGAV